MNKKKPAAISLDLDNQWSYMKTHGDIEWIERPSYYDIFVPYILDILNDLDIRITFFIVGYDASVEKNKIWLKKIAENGHDIGNHSYQHEVWINTYTKEEVNLELETAENTIELATGKKPVGYRGPGFCRNEILMEVLNERNYLYDASMLPTFIGPLARMYYFRRSAFSKEDKSKRSDLFGKFSEGFQKIRPHYYKLNSGRQILEIPVTTIPFFRVPFHMSYLIYLSNFSPLLMKIYLEFALFMCRLTGTPVSFLLHPLDIIGGDHIKSLRFFPGMTISSKKKIKVFKYVIKTLKKHYELTDMQTFANVLKTTL